MTGTLSWATLSPIYDFSLRSITCAPATMLRVFAAVGPRSIPEAIIAFVLDTVVGLSSALTFWPRCSIARRQRLFFYGYMSWNMFCTPASLRFW